MNTRNKLIDMTHWRTSNSVNPRCFSQERFNRIFRHGGRTCCLYLLNAPTSTHMHVLNPLKPNSSNCYTMPCRPNLPFSISDIRAIWRSGLNARVPECTSEIENGRLGVHGTERLKYNHLMTLGFAWLTSYRM